VCEKDAVVVRYAKNESELINIRKEKENLLKRLKNVENERDDLNKKVKSLNSEKISISQTLDSKVGYLR
jgi:predicted nuclease with TOPRIM domain